MERTASARHHRVILPRGGLLRGFTALVDGPPLEPDEQRGTADDSCQNERLALFPAWSVVCLRSSVVSSRDGGVREEVARWRWHHCGFLDSRRGDGRRGIVDEMGI